MPLYRAKELRELLAEEHQDSDWIIATI